MLQWTLSSWFRTPPLAIIFQTKQWASIIVRSKRKEETNLTSQDILPETATAAAAAAITTTITTSTTTLLQQLQSQILYCNKYFYFLKLYVFHRLSVFVSKSKDETILLVPFFYQGIDYPVESVPLVCSSW